MMTMAMKKNMTCNMYHGDVSVLEKAFLEKRLNNEHAHINNNDDCDKYMSGELCLQQPSFWCDPEPLVQRCGLMT